MTLADLVAHYGYGAVFAGSLLEGETILLLAGAAAHKGYLSFAGVVALAFCGGTLGDQILFAVGRRYGTLLLARHPRLATRAEPVKGLIRRHQNGLIVGVRFMYGLRLIGPLVIGMSEVSARRFVLLNLLGAAIWAPLVVGAGYLFGHALSWLFAGIQRFELVAFGGLALALCGLALWRWWRASRDVADERESQR
ncbi:MAG: DedA family protein [Burkholderiales bacterium]